MNYRKKTFIPFAIMAILIIETCFLFYYWFNVSSEKKERFSQMEGQAEQISNEVDMTLEKMKFAVSNVLSSKDVLDGLWYLQKVDDTTENKAEIAKAINSLRSNLAVWYLTRNFYKIVVFNDKGIAITSSGKINEENVIKIWNQNNYEQKAGTQKSGYYIWGNHREFWNENDEQEVISIVQKVKGYRNTFIEVEYLVNNLILPADVNFCLLDDTNRMVYISDDTMKSSVEKLWTLHAEEKKWSAGNKDVLCYGTKSDINGHCVIVITPQSILDASKERIFINAAILFGTITVALLLYVLVWSSKLTTPICKLNELVRSRNIENISEPFEFNSDIVEVDSLGKSFGELLQSLNRSVEIEKNAVQLQMQAQFDALQAGVNPHFIFNVLNVIANRGLQLEDDEICRICNKLAVLLQYSTNTNERSAPVTQELKYLDNYFYLIKARFKERFSYECVVSEPLESLLIPKLGLQQIVENCIKHGFKERNKPMKVTIRGYEDCQYYVLEIQDNGVGFPEEILANIKLQMEEGREHFHYKQKGFELGGMGLVNTYLRFFCMYGEHIQFLLTNNQVGACVTIKIEKKDEHV